MGGIERMSQHHPFRPPAAGLHFADLQSGGGGGDDHVIRDASFDDGEQLRDINTPENLLLSKQIGETVNAAMDALPEELRTAIMLRELEGLSYEEIAKIMDCPIGTIRSRIFRAREAVATKLRPLLDTNPDRRW